MEADLTYYRRVAYAEGCETWKATAEVLIEQTPAIYISIVAPASICAGEPTFISVEGPTGLTYLWSTTDEEASISVRPTEETTYSVTVTNAAGCTQTAAQTIMVIPTEPSTVEEQVICVGEEILLTASGGINYEWRLDNDLIGTAASIEVSPTITSTYEVKIISENACAGTVFYPVLVRPAIDLALSSTAPSCIDGSADGVISITSATSVDGHAPKIRTV